MERFHAERPGITERVLARCRSAGIDPYRWSAQPFSQRDGPVLDIACGSGALADHVADWIGTDLSEAELNEARARNRGPLLRSSATRLPIASGATGAVVCSMAMQVLEPVSAAVAELARVLRPGGRAVLLLPATRPLGWRDAVTYLRLEAVLRRRIRYPNDAALGRGRLGAAAARSGLAIASDERRGFALAIDSYAHVDDLLRSLYLPGVEPGRLRHARRVLSHRIGTDLTVPLRRVVLDAR